MSRTEKLISEVDRWSAHNYHPLPVVLERGEGCWVWDVEGNRYLDMLSAYSAVNQGHRHPRIIAALNEQAGRLTLTSRAFHNDQMGAFLHQLCELVGYEKALPMNTGAEAVETAIKAVRKWGYTVKGVAPDKAEIIVCDNNFHGRTTTIVGFSSEEAYRSGFGPFTPGFKLIPYGDVDALAGAMTEHTVGFLVEPLQGEGGVVVPPEGFLKAAARLCREHGVKLMSDEIQTGLGRTGRMLCSEWEDVRADVVMLGKALGGGVYPVSACVADDEVMDVFTPGDHGSTFGGNPLAAAVGRAALDVIVDEDLPGRAAELGAWFVNELQGIDSPHVEAVRGKGLMVGVVIKESSGTARPFCEKLMERRILAKETHRQVVRFAPPLVITREILEEALESIREVLLG
ncbi:MAG: ornithine--oxo-acid transaminase [Gemmatimonadetes bacterium]|uniref:ornithine aminotransferase n=1 Tax=Candidatus Kutchimonas denitrificans TaxID=3056748 RepID=A0AAE4ZB56_9BACT|nr:ornithine--oxo-acid transaminase [Gemmatimonadota bacterium]NIR74200.1 ornithine--oxo-acid transaminase [Candidatus Kutchimonas denitrificans]NIR99822.1 ornithine--oxo-acid transaminase [Gemmatimonadota bacterium]NIT65411.1 ornithine--oxo-acid transaminase [Gemmatimonadota bacterium]NIU51777.1 ornithine--oxo-acid transaminase [Gemmatimonadota bacterium]